MQARSYGPLAKKANVSLCDFFGMFQEGRGTLSLPGARYTIGCSGVNCLTEFFDCRQRRDVENRSKSFSPSSSPVVEKPGCWIGEDRRRLLELLHLHRGRGKDCTASGICSGQRGGAIRTHRERSLIGPTLVLTGSAQVMRMRWRIAAAAPFYVSND